MSTAKGKFDIIGAWTGLSCLNNPSKAIQLAKNAGINHIDIMINDGTAKKQFHIYHNEQKILDVVKQIQNEGISVSFTTWVLPTEEWIAGIKDVLVPLANKAGVTEICFDLEEPWINPQKNSKDLTTIIKRVYWSTILQNAVHDFKGKKSATVIVYTNFDVLNFALSWVDRIIPQCYSTLLNCKNRKPGDLERLTHKIYDHYKTCDVMGAAGWNLEGAYGLHANDALYAALNASVELGYKEVRFWRLDFLTGKYAQTLKEFR